MHVPIPNAQRGTPEYLYTKAHCSDRNAIERCIGVLKARWRCLLWDRTLHFTPLKAGLIVNACVVLHNFCRMRNVQDPPPVREPRDNRANNVPDEDEIDLEDAGVRQLRILALQERQFLIEHVAR